jgi:hypothetical protein
MRTTLRITDRKKHAAEVPIFASKHPDDNAIYVVVKTSNGLVALDRDYNPRGYILDPGTLWDELENHRANLVKEFARSFDDGKVTGDAIWLDLDS